LDEARGFLYGSGDGSRLLTAPGSTVASLASASLDSIRGFLSLDLLLDRRPDATEGSFLGCSDAFLEILPGLPLLLLPVCGEAVFPSTSCCVSSRRAL